MGEDSILARTARGAGWMIAWRLATRMLGLVSTLIPVRLLAPGDFGLVALATAFVITLEVCLALGVEDQIVRAEAPGRELYDTAFTLNLLRGVAVGALLVAASAPAAEFFNEPRLYWVLLALAVSATLSGAESMGVVDFRRNLQFEREFLLQIAPRLVSIAVTITLAFLVQSHWALVSGILVSRIGLVAMGYAMHPYRPRLTMAAWRDLASVSAWSWALGVATILRDRSDSFVIGRSLGSTPLGHYSAGAEIAILPATELVDPICRACMPGFAASKRAGEGDAASDYLRILSLLALLTLPAGLGISLVAGPVVALAFGQAWLGAVPVIMVMGAGSVLNVFGTMSWAMLTAHTKLGSMVWITLASAAARLGLLLMLTPAYGLFGAAVAVSLSMLAEHMLMVTRTMHLLRIGPAALMMKLWRPLAGVGAMSAALWSVGLGWAPAPDTAGKAAELLAEAVALGVTTYGLMVFILWLAAGRPDGPELDLVGLARRLIAKGGKRRATSFVVRNG